MNIDWKRLLPVIVSILIIIIIAIVSRSSGLLAAIVATVPTKIMLSLWIINANTQGDQQSLVDFTGGAMTGLMGSVAFVLTAWIMARSGFTLMPTLTAGMVAWILVFGLMQFVKRAVGV